jgi:hypothetical protein
MVYNFIPRPKVPVNVLYLENMLIVFLRTFGRRRPPTAPNLNKEKGKAPMAGSSQKNHAYLYDKKVTSNTHHDRRHNHVVYPICHDAAFNSHAMFASSSSYAHGRNRPRRHYAASHAPRRASTGPTMLYQTCNASFVLTCKNDKVVARSVGPKCKRDKTCIWVPKSVVTNLVGPNKSWVPKTQA